VENLRAIARLLDRHDSPNLYGDWGWPTSDSEWADWIDRHDSEVLPFLTSPWGTQASYTFTDNHHSYTLDYNDTSGALVVSLLAGASHRVGPIAYRADALMRTPVGRATENFIWNKSSRSSPVGNIVADAMREMAASDIALHNFLGMRAHLARGTITREHLSYVLPFANKLAAVRMTGQELKAELNRSIRLGTPWFVSGVSRNSTGQYHDDHDQLIHDDAFYTVAVSDYVARGGRYNDYAQFVALKHVDVPDVDLADALAEYIRHHSPISPDTTNRLRVGE